MTVLPAATLPARGVMERLEPEVSLPFVPRFLIRHTFVPATYVSAGQDALDPVQSPAGPRSPGGGRQTLPAFAAACWDTAFAPSHWSRAHAFVSAVQAVLAAFTTSAGQTVLVPVQVSATSHSPAAARQTAP